MKNFKLWAKWAKLDPCLYEVFSFESPLKSRQFNIPRNVYHDEEHIGVLWLRKITNRGFFRIFNGNGKSDLVRNGPATNLLNMPVWKNLKGVVTCQHPFFWEFYGCLDWMSLLAKNWHQRAYILTVCPVEDVIEEDLVIWVINMSRIRYRMSAL